MIESRIEKKFVFVEGDDSYKYFLISGMFKKIYFQRIVNSIYIDNENFKNVWDNINGFPQRSKYRIRWYNTIKNSKIFFEEKNKLNQTTFKNKNEIGPFKNEDDLMIFLNSDEFKKNFLSKYKFNLKNILKVSYKRSYYIDPKNKIRATLDKNITINKKYLNNKEGIYLDKNILELKYKVEDSNYCNELVLNSKLENRNKKYSKYVQSFVEMNESGLV
tara:strand:- start:25 stop:678 length:654 start_codon:yes stop_codon:yes gene_type:complete